MIAQGDFRLNSHRTIFHVDTVADQITTKVGNNAIRRAQGLRM
jgi:hypothetical protein